MGNNVSSAVVQSGSWESEGQLEAVRQVAELLAQVTSLELRLSGSSRVFELAGKDDTPRPGIIAAHGELGEDGVLVVQLELVRASEGIRVPPAPLFERLSKLGQRVRLAAPRRDPESSQASLWVEMSVKASPMSMSRSNAFLGELRQLDELACALQSELPVPWTNADLDALYEPVSDYVEPILPWDGEVDPATTGHLAWARETIDFLDGGTCVAVASPRRVVEQFALALLARASQERDGAIGRLKTTTINSQGLVELNRKSPGTLAVPAHCVSIGSNLYDLTDQIGPLLAALEAEKPVIFCGTFDQLQAAMSGGQGGASDPLVPIVRHAPEIPLVLLARFAVRSAGRHVGGLAASAEDELKREVLSALEAHDPAEQWRLLPMVALRTVQALDNSKQSKGPSAATYASTVSRLSETLGGLSERPRARRAPEVQARFTQVLTDHELLPYLQAHLVGQDMALGQLVARLRMEALTRPQHQPIRWCAQGSPATGKSESAILLAKRLGIPYVNVDAASMSSHHTAAAQLLGSARGVVNSYQAGRLEQAAKHSTGVLIEVSDLDHANPDVRAALADLFLMVLETGEAQSSKGSVFSCAQLVLAFTMNLPEGKDETVRKGLGFHGSPSRSEVLGRVADEIKGMLSSAFLSRVGTPVLFEPLDDAALSTIVERAIERAVHRAAEHLRLDIGEVRLEDGLGVRVLATMDANTTSFGARALLEHGRLLAASAFVELHQSGASLSGKALEVAAGPEGKIVIIPTRAP